MHNNSSIGHCPNHRGRLTDHIKNLLTHRYLVILASFLTNGIIFGVINSFGVLYVHLLTFFKNGTKDAAFSTSLVGSILIGTTFSCSALSSIITDKFGIRSTTFIGGFLATLGMFTSSFSSSIYELYITYGLLLGFGVSLCYAPSLVILGHYFTSNLGLVNGIVTAGSSVFTMILPICLKMLINRFSLFFALRLFSLLISVLMICALTFKEKHEFTNHSSTSTEYRIKDSEQFPTTTNNNNNHHSKKTHSTVGTKISSNSPSSTANRKQNLINYTIWRNPLYLLWVISVPIALVGYFVPHFHLVKHASDILPGSNGELLVTCIGATSGIGRLVFGQISDIQSVNPVVLQQIALLAIGGSTMLFTIAKSYVLLLILCAIFGLFDGCFVSLMGPVAYSLVGKEGASQAIGFVLGLSSIPFMLGPPLAGYLYDLNGDYFYAFLLGGLPPFIGALIMIPIVSIQRRRANRSLKQLEAKSGEITATTGTINGFDGDCSAMATEIDPLTSSLISDNIKSHFHDNHKLYQHNQQNSHPNDLHHNNHPNHHHQHQQQISCYKPNNHLHNGSNHHWINNSNDADESNNCPENVSLLNKPSQPTVILCENQFKST
ncbi:monocarboxylate transporter 10 [Tetranychus urticae]|uniref:Major facilitator superfamily (MFS) profile domain-containing protein n=1 Tax=Tetranychus urticae TaxID=32264 RepID=T1K9D0_TETUR|nr:monocarboxylate transporter 10 [Tetranychus urticae]XP_015784143.1 monocarboxylate transporter 10 [Tetranychus urticae]